MDQEGKYDNDDNTLYCVTLETPLTYLIFGLVYLAWSANILSFIHSAWSVQYPHAFAKNMCTTTFYMLRFKHIKHFATVLNYPETWIMQISSYFVTLVNRAWRCLLLKPKFCFTFYFVSFIFWLHGKKKKIYLLSRGCLNSTE